MMISIVEYGELFIFISMLAASIIAIAVGVERAIVYIKNQKDDQNILQNLISKIRSKDLNSAREYSNQNTDSIYGRFANFSLQNYGFGAESLSKLMEGKIMIEKVELEKRMSILGTLGNNAPFIGLLGTVLGVIKAFHGLGTLGSSGAEVVMRSISTALLATAAGLAVAIPVVITNNYFIRKMKVMISNLEMLSKEFLASLYSTKQN